MKSGVNIKLQVFALMAIFLIVAGCSSNRENPSPQQTTAPQNKQPAPPATSPAENSPSANADETSLSTSAKEALLLAREGDRLLSDGKQEEALENFKKALEVDNSSLEAYERLVFILIEKKKNEDAGIQMARKGLTNGRPPKTARDFFFYGRLYSRISQRSKKAMKCLDRAIELDSSNSEYYFHRGCLHSANNDLKKAEADYRTALEKANDDGGREDAREALSRLGEKPKKVESPVEKKEDP